jgi:hypothetical protein
MLRLACALLLVSQILLLPLLLAPSGQRAIVFSFVATPLLAIGLVLWLLWWLRWRQED